MSKSLRQLIVEYGEQKSGEGYEQANIEQSEGDQDMQAEHRRSLKKYERRANALWEQINKLLG